MLLPEFPPLTQKKVDKLLFGKRPYTEKREHTRRLLKSFGFGDVTDAEMDFIMRVYITEEQRRLSIEHSEAVAKGKIVTNKTPTDVSGGFEKVSNPLIGERYHLSWAYKGAVFVLKKVDGSKAYLDNPKHSRLKQGKGLLEVNVSDLRNLRKHA